MSTGSCHFKISNRKKKNFKSVFKTSIFKHQISGINTRSSVPRTTGSFLLIQPEVLWKWRPPSSQAAKTAPVRSAHGSWKSGRAPGALHNPLGACFDPFFSPILKREKANPEAGAPKLWKHVWNKQATENTQFFPHLCLLWFVSAWESPCAPLDPETDRTTGAPVARIGLNVQGLAWNINSSKQMVV